MYVYTCSGEGEGPFWVGVDAPIPPGKSKVSFIVTVFKDSLDLGELKLRGFKAGMFFKKKGVSREKLKMREHAYTRAIAYGSRCPVLFVRTAAPL